MYLGNLKISLFGQSHGKGTFYAVDGSVIYEGNWEYDQPVK